MILKSLQADTRKEHVPEQQANVAGAVQDDQPASQDNFASDLVALALRNHGNFSVAYSTAVQAGLEHFGDSRGYIAFQRLWGVAYALGDPVCDDNHRADLIADFVDQNPKAMFCQISQSTAEALPTNKFYVNAMGLDTRLDLREYSLKGKTKEWLRYARNWTKRRGYQVKELSDDPAELAQVIEISQHWRETRTIRNREVRFINRPFQGSSETDVRKLLLVNDTGVPEAFVFFDPLYRNKEVIGYVTSFKRRLPTTTTYAEAAIMATAIERFQEENRQSLYLGLSPLAGLDNSQYRANPLMSIAFRYYSRSWWVNRFFYHFQAHANYKKRYRGITEPVYLATNSFFNDVRLLGLIRLCGLL